MNIGVAILNPTEDTFLEGGGTYPLAHGTSKEFFDQVVTASGYRICVLESALGDAPLRAPTANELVAVDPRVDLYSMVGVLTEECLDSNTTKAEQDDIAMAKVVTSNITVTTPINLDILFTDVEALKTQMASVPQAIEVPVSVDGDMSLQVMEGQTTLHAIKTDPVCNEFHFISIDGADSKAGLGDKLRLDVATGLLRIAPLEGDTGVYTVKVAFTRGLGWGEALVTINIFTDPSGGNEEFQTITFGPIAQGSATVVASVGVNLTYVTDGNGTGILAGDTDEFGVVSNLMIRDAQNFVTGETISITEINGVAMTTNANVQVTVA